MEDVLIEAFHDLDEDGSGRVTRAQLGVLTKKLGIEDHNRLFEALDRNGTGFVTLEDLLNRFYSSSNDEIQEEEESEDGGEEMSSNDDEEEETEFENDNPVRGIMSLLSSSKLSSLKANEFREALEEYIQRRLSLEESKALSKVFDMQCKKKSTFDDAAIGTVLSNWQSLLQGEEVKEEEEEEETNSNMNVKIITEEEEATTYVSPAKASKSPRNSLNSENLAEALKRSEHQLRKLREHVQRQRRFIEEQSAAHESVTAKHKLEFERRLERETRKLRRQFEKEHERANETETRCEKHAREKHELLLKVRDLEEERSSRTRNQKFDKAAAERARDEARETMKRLESEYRDTVRDLTNARTESNRRVETLKMELKGKEDDLRNTQSELEEMNRRHTAQNAIHESLRQTIRDLEDVVMTLRGQSPRKMSSRSPSPKQRKHRSPSAFARFPKRKSWNSKPSHAKRSLSVPSRQDNSDEGGEDVLNDSLADELAALNDESTNTIISAPATPTTTKEEEVEEERKEESTQENSSLVSFLNKQCNEAASLVKADKATTSSSSSSSSSPTSSSSPSPKMPKRRKSKTSASLVHQMLQEATALAHTFKGDYLEIVTHRQALLRHRIHSAGGSVQERLLFSSVVVRLIQPSKIVGFFSSEARQWRRVLVLTNHALYEMSDVLSLQVRRRVPLSSICTVALMTDSHDVFALLRRTSYDRVYQTMRRTELIVRIMQACENLRDRHDRVSDDESISGKRRKDSVRYTVSQAQKQVDSGEMSRQEFDAVVRSCARHQTRRYTKPPLRVRFLSKMLLSFSGGEIKQMYYNESSGQIHIVPQDARESAPNAEMAGFVCPMCKIQFATAAKLLEHYDSVHPA